MRVYIAGENGKGRIIRTINEDLSRRGTLLQEWQGICRGGLRPYILETFYYARKNPAIKDLLPLYGDILLDSGAFTFKRDKKGGTHLDWLAYCKEYAEFVKLHNIEKFFELDIDDLVGIRAVEDYRKMLEDITGRQPIPVWHPQRGYDYYLRMCEEYKYVAYGAFITDNIPMSVNEKVLPTFINEAHRRGVKIHALGYTNIEGLKRYPFDSVDSTAWLYGNRGGYLYIFNPAKGNFKKIERKEGMRLDARASAEHNFLEWIKFQKYAEKFL